MKNTALVTGASSGIGRELARCHASKGGDLVVVARREKSLEELKTELEQKYKIKVMVLAVDLSEPSAAETVFRATEAEKIEVDILINNAGFGGHGKFYQRDLKKEQAMVQVNIVSLINLTHLYLQGMVQRNRGRILHVASTAGFIPGPLQAIYFATKSFVLSFSQATAQELASTQVTCTALCPGPVATEFAQAGDLEETDLFKRAVSAKSVAVCGYNAMERGQLVVINEKALDFVLHWLLPWMPRKLVLKIVEKSMQK